MISVEAGFFQINSALPPIYPLIAVDAGMLSLSPGLIAWRGQKIHILSAGNFQVQSQTPGQASDFNGRIIPDGRLSLCNTLQGTPHREIWWLKDQPVTAQLVYICTLTGDADGLDDVTLPMSSFQYRMYVDERSYVAATIPNAVKYANQIAARINGQIIIRRGYKYDDGSVNLSEIVRGGSLRLRYDTGGRSSSVTLSAGGQVDFSFDPAVVKSTSNVVSERLQANGDYHFQIAPIVGLYPNDHVWLSGTRYKVKQINVAVGERHHQMNLTVEPA